MLVLRPGIPAQPITGTPAVPTLSVRFQDGVVDIHDIELVEKMRNHPGFNVDFVEVEEQKSDPYYRKPVEPQHVMTELKYGTPIARETSKIKRELPPELEKLIQEQAVAIAKEMLPGMVEATLKAMAANGAAEARTPLEAADIDEDDSEIVEEVPVAEGPKKRGPKPKTA